jgi:hypothetical protein
MTTDISIQESYKDYQDYIASHKESVGFNLDATNADRLHIKHVESFQPCELCSYEQTTNINPDCPTVFSVINPVYCVFNRISVGKKIYNRSRIFDGNLAHIAKEDERCPCCGIPVGFIHHVYCEFDVCPACNSDYCWCNHPVGYSTLDKSILDEHPDIDYDVNDLDTMEKIAASYEPVERKYFIERDYIGE